MAGINTETKIYFLTNICCLNNLIVVLFLQDPLMRRMEGSHIMPPGAVIHHRIPIRRPNKITLWIKNFQFQAKKIDVFSRVFFPFVFAIFNIWYWSYYLTRAQNGNK